MQSVPAPLVPSLHDVRMLFETWRTTRQYRCRIPDQLWAAATTLSSSYPLSKISTTLRLNYSDLKKRVDEFSFPHRPESTEEISFVELPIRAAETTRPTQRGPHPCTLELEKPSGERLSCTFYASFPEELVPLLKTFFSAKP